MKTKCGLDAVIKHTDDTLHYGIVEGKAFAKWDKTTGVCVDPCNNSAFDLMIEQKPKYELPDPTNRHYKFASHCASIGYPDIECFQRNKEPHSWEFIDFPSWHHEADYRIAGDKHHELRREWIDSDFTLPIEFKPLSSGDWILQSSPTWSEHSECRKAEQKPLWHDYVADKFAVILKHPDYDGKLRMQDGLPITEYNAKAVPITTLDGKYLAAFKDGNLHILPVERGDTQLGINSEMDKLVRDNGLGHWSCVGVNHREWWKRMPDELEASICEYGTEDMLISQLKDVDKQNPLKG